MLTHPYFLDLLSNFKKSKDDIIPKELLVLCVYNKNCINDNYVYDLLYKYKKTKLKKVEILDNILKLKEKWFKYENNIYKLISTDDLSKECLFLIEKDKSCTKKDLVKILYQEIDKIEIFNYDLLIKLVYKITDLLKSSEINLKKFIGNMQNKFNSIENKNNLIFSRQNIAKDFYSGDNSILNFVTKREKLNFSNTSKFNPIYYDSSVYVYRLNNPCYESIRKRKDLINPTKKIFIKFSDEFRPSIYKIPDYQLKIKNSIKKLNNIDYEEDSTWEDDTEGEDIVSDESEEEEYSGDEEWIDSDSYDEENIKNIKKPTMIFPKIKLIKNENFDLFWNDLLLEKTDKISQELKEKIKEFKINEYGEQIYNSKEYDIKHLSNLFMIKENILDDFLSN